MTAFALPLPSPSITFAISIAVAIALAADAIAKNKDKSKIVNGSYHRALRKPSLSKRVIFWQRGFLKVGYCKCGNKFRYTNNSGVANISTDSRVVLLLELLFALFQ
jgi:hypothetical protein